MPVNKDPWNDEADRELELNKSEAHYVEMALEFAAEHEDGWEGRDQAERMKDVAERAKKVRKGE